MMPKARFFGVIKTVPAGKRFAFIRPDGGGNDLFAHFAEVRNAGELAVGDKVSFDVVPDRVRADRQRAVDVRVLS
jgi:CspA family cold shock protein